MKKILKISEFILNNAQIILLLLFFIIVSSNILYKHLRFDGIRTPSYESRFNLLFANDFYTSVYNKANQMLSGEHMTLKTLYPEHIDSAAGQFFPVLLSPFLSFFSLDRYQSYAYFVLLTLIIFAVFFCFLMKKERKKTIVSGLILMFGFFLSVPGYLGIYMGNTDIILAPLLGIIIIFTLGYLNREDISFFQVFSLGILSGIVLNAKFFLLPFIIFFVLFSKRSLLLLITTILTFLTLIYFPNIFNSESNIWLYLSKVFAWGSSNNPVSYQAWGNHSFFIIASFFSRCMEVDNQIFQYLNKLIVFVMFIFVFLYPFFISRITKQEFKKFLPMLRSSKEFFLILMTLSVAFINLIPNIVFTYRLFYSLIVLLIVFVNVNNSKKALFYCYLSMFFLLLNGTWFLKITNKDIWGIDPRILNIFILFHFFFLILSAVSYWKDSLVLAKKQKKQKNKKKSFINLVWNLEKI